MRKRLVESATRTRATKRNRDSNLLQPAPDALGVSKIKASLRQTRRLLARGTLKADVQVATERRLKSLESDLARAVLARKERAFALKYRRVKFFERQKVTRKISQIKRQLAHSVNPDVGESLESSLGELRVDLNYIRYYPRTKKYISLFPPEVRQGKVGQENTDKEELRAWIRERMAKGEIPVAPDLEHEVPTQVLKRGASIAVPQARAESGPVGDLKDDELFGEDDEVVDESTEDSEV